MSILLSDESRKAIVDFIKASQDRIGVNTEIFSILEGKLKPLLEQRMLEDLGPKSFEAAKSRIAPINYYRKVIDKLTSIYNQGVVRTVMNGTESDQELVEWYEKKLNLNHQLNNNNESLNAYKYSLLQMTLDDPNPITNQRNPFVRTIPNHEFLIMNTSRVDPTSPDVIIIFMGKRGDGTGKEEYVYHVYTDEEFIIINGSGDLLLDEMERLGLDGDNVLGIKPFVYANMSHNLVMPMPQVDDLSIAVLVPLLLTDLNYAVKFQAFSMFIAIDIDDSKIEISPNSVQHLKSDPAGDKPSFDTIKPTVDIAEVLSLGSSQISLWLSSKGIRPGSIGQMSGDQFASGISKMIDESDTFESRKLQIEIYKAFEREFWDKLLKFLHPLWVTGNLVDNRTIFSPSAEVVTEFPEPKPMQTRLDLIEEVKAVIDAGLESRAGALAELHPDWSEEDIEAKIQEIDDEARKVIMSNFGGSDAGAVEQGNETEDQGAGGFN